MMMRMLRYLLLAAGMICCGCQRQNTAISPAVDAVKEVADKKEQTPKVIAYYFHRTVRCPTCIAIEARVARIIETDFKQQSADGRLAWMPFNLDEPGGDAFEKEFDISVSTLVLAKTKNGDQTGYKKLEEVWQLYHDPEAFNNYVKDEIGRFLDEQLAN